MSARSTGLRPWIGACLLAACQAPTRQTAPIVDTAGAPQPAAAPAPRPSDFAGPVEVAVLIQVTEGRREFLLESGGRTVQVRRLGAGVSARGQVHATFSFPPAWPDADISIEGKAYAGRFEVRPRSAGGLSLFNLVDLESYVAGVVASEVPLWSALPAELEAQAVAARTYALHTLGRRRAGAGDGASRGPFLFDSVADQAYRGRPANDLALVRDPEVRARLEAAVERAVEATRGVVLTRDGFLEDARFHAACGGRTSSLADIFPESGAGSGATDCPCEDPDQGTGGGAWKHTFTAAQLASLARRLGIGERVLSIVPSESTEPTATTRWIEVQIRGDRGERSMPFLEFRQIMGAGELRSGRIDGTWPHPGVTIGPKGGWAVYGRGHGHGAGLCQRGTHVLAGRGWSARRILAHYYRGTAQLPLPSS